MSINRSRINDQQLQSKRKLKQSSSSSVDSAVYSSEIVSTPRKKVVAGTGHFVWVGSFGFASICAYYIDKELIPAKMSPNVIFDCTSDAICNNEDVKRLFGMLFKTYWQEHSRHCESRRNFIEHANYNNPDDMVTADG